MNTSAPQVAAHTDRETRHMELDSQIEAMSGAVSRVHELLNRIKGIDSDVKTGHPVAVPTLADVLEHGPTRLGDIRGQLNNAIDELESILF